MIDHDEDQLAYAKESVKKEVESESFWHNEKCDVSDLIVKMESTDSVAETDSEAQVDLESVPAIHVPDEGDSFTKMESNDLILDIDVNREVESLEVASVREKDSGDTYEMLDSEQIESPKNEVPIYLLESSHKIEDVQPALLENSGSEFLSNDSRNDHRLGVSIASKEEEIYILDVDMREELIRKAVEGVDFAAHQLSDQMLLRVFCKMNQRRYQKDWTFKYKLKKRSHHFSDKVCTEMEELQVVVCNNINGGFGWDNFCGFHEELLKFCATDGNMVLTENVGQDIIAEVMSHGTVIPVPSLSQKERERLRGLHKGFQTRYVGQEERGFFFYTQMWQRVAVRGRCNNDVTVIGRGDSLLRSLVLTALQTDQEAVCQRTSAAFHEYIARVDVAENGKCKEVWKENAEKIQTRQASQVLEIQVQRHDGDYQMQADSEGYSGV